MDNATQKAKARAQVQIAIAARRIVKPDQCSACGAVGSGGNLHGHHTDYNLPLDVVWLCPACHGERHRGERDKSPTQGTATPLGIRLKNARRRAGLTAWELAELLGVKRLTVWRWENTPREPSLNQLRQLAVLYELPIGYFFGDDNPPGKQEAA